MDDGPLEPDNGLVNGVDWPWFGFLPAAFRRSCQSPIGVPQAAPVAGRFLPLGPCLHLVPAGLPSVLPELLEVLVQLGRVAGGLVGLIFCQAAWVF